MRRAVAALALAMPLAIPAALLAHGGREHVSGMITQVDRNRITVETGEGEASMIGLTPETRFLGGGGPSDLSVGSRVVVDVTGDEANFVAREVRIDTSALAPARTAGHGRSQPSRPRRDVYEPSGADRRAGPDHLDRAGDEGPIDWPASREAACEREYRRGYEAGRRDAYAEREHRDNRYRPSYDLRDDSWDEDGDDDYEEDRDAHANPSCLTTAPRRR